MTKARIKPKWVVFAVTLAGMLLYRQFIYRPDIVRPSRWQLRSEDGIRALEARRFDDAERCFLDAAEEAKSFPVNDPRRGTSAHNLANLRLGQRRFDDAEPLYRDAMRLLATGRRDDELESGAILIDLASIRLMKKDFAESESLVRRAIKLNERLRGKNDPVVANNYRTLAAVLLAQGKPGNAVSAATRAAQISEKHDSPETREGDAP